MARILLGSLALAFAVVALNGCRSAYPAKRPCGVYTTVVSETCRPVLPPPPDPCRP